MFFRHYASSYGLLNYPSLWNSCHIALIWFLPRMYFEMTCKITIPWKGLVTLTAVICFIRNVFCFSSKCIFKWLVKLLFLEKRLITLTALIFFHSECFLNISKITICWKCNRIFAALIFFQPSMCSNMLYKLNIAKKLSHIGCIDTISP